jgi:hypothetical protein
MEAIEYLEALGGLSEVYSQKKYGTIENHNSSFSKNELDIIHKFEKEYNLNWDDLSLKNLPVFEEFLDDEITKIADHGIIDYPVDDEIKLIRDGIELDVNYFREYDFKLGENVKPFLAQYKFSKMDILDGIRNPVQIFQFNNGSFLIKTRHRINSDDPWSVVGLLNIEKQGVKTVTIHSYIATHESLTEGYSAIRLFLSLLNWYGVKLNFNGKVKKFFYEEFNPGNNIDFSNLFQSEKPSNNTTLFMNIRTGYVSATIAFLYGFNTNLYFSEFKRKEI